MDILLQHVAGIYIMARVCQGLCRNVEESSLSQRDFWRLRHAILLFAVDYVYITAVVTMLSGANSTISDQHGRSGHCSIDPGVCCYT